jgi:Putative peptidoglycan binding domain
VKRGARNIYRGTSVTVPRVDRGPDPDDWFGDPDPEDRRLPDVPPDETVAQADDWLDDEIVGREPRPSWVQSIDRRMVTVAVCLIALLIAGLAAGGVFSSSSTPTTITTPSLTAATQTTAAATTTAPQQLPAPATTLKPGDTGTQVAVLQRALASLGFSSGKADGVYGPATTTALKRFQQSKGLTADGILGPATLRTLGTALHGA